MKFIITNIALLCFGITLQAHTAATVPTPSQPSVIPRYTGIGYNALKANPDGDFNNPDIDPGIFQTRFIFRLTYSERKQVSYQGTLISIPDQVEFVPFTICVRRQSTDVISGQTSYQEKLSRSVDHSLTGNYASIVSAQFSLSDAMSRMRQETENRRSVVVQKMNICNYGEARYKLANALNNTPGYDLTTDFKSAVGQLPSTYSINHYAQFLNDWGTHIIETTTVGTREIIRRSASYEDVYEFLSEQSSRSLGAGISVSLRNGTGGGGYSFALSSSELNSRINFNTQIGESLNEMTIGTQIEPLPTHISAVPIHRALEDNLWAVHERASIRQKRANLQRALREYARNRQAQIAPDPLMLLEFQWPRGQFSLVKPASGCPARMSWGWRYQDNQDGGNNNSWDPYDLDSCVDISPRGNVKTNFCTKESESGSPSWPRGIYCIAKYGSSCPSGFREGSIYWDDEDDSNDNAVMQPVPSGQYNRNTKINFCCRSDGNHDTPITLPPTEPFALYRYHRRCQRVRGMNEPMELWVHSDDEDTGGNDNSCSGSHPDASCNHNQKLYYCYYTPRLMNGCKMNPCTSGRYTVCEPTGDHCNAYDCRCEHATSETHCVAKFRVKARLARNLRRDIDGPGDNCDPYMVITARTLDGRTITKKSSHLNNDANPDWNEWFDFGRGEWKNVTVSIWDHDRNSDDRLSNDYTFDLLMGGYDDKRFDCFGGGHGIFNYRLTI